MSDFSRYNRGYCRTHKQRVLLDEGCPLCDAQRPRCQHCGDFLTQVEIDDQIARGEYCFCCIEKANEEVSA